MESEMQLLMLNVDKYTSKPIFENTHKYAHYLVFGLKQTLSSQSKFKDNFYNHSAKWKNSLQY